MKVWKQSCSDDKGLEVVWKCTCDQEKIGVWANGTFRVFPKVNKKWLVHEKNLGKTWVELQVKFGGYNVFPHGKSFNVKDRDRMCVWWPQEMMWGDVIAKWQGFDSEDCRSQSSDEDLIDIVSVQAFYLPKPSTSIATASSNALEEVD